jgi:hypothetical protein
VNYVDHRDVEAIRRTIATALLFDGSGYVVGPTVDDEIDDAYFIDLGKPVAPRVDRGDVSYREFERGTVVVNAGTEPFRLPSGVVDPGSHLIWRQDR